MTKKTELQIYNEICKALGDWDSESGSVKGVTKPQRIVNLRSTVRYFVHLDNPKKEQFDLSKTPILDFGGFDSSKYLVGKAEKDKEKFSSIRDVIKIIKDKQFDHIIDLLDFLGTENDNLFTIVCENAYLCTQLVSKYRNFPNKERKILKTFVEQAL